MKGKQLNREATKQILLIKNIEINNARPSKTWLDGVCCKPMACLKIAKTTITLVNDVIIINSAGSKVRAVMIAKI